MSRFWRSDAIEPRRNQIEVQLTQMAIHAGVEAGAPSVGEVVDLRQQASWPLFSNVGTQGVGMVQGGGTLPERDRRDRGTSHR